MTLNDYESLPWTVHGRAMREGAGDEAFYLITIEELEGFSVVTDTRAEAESLLPQVLREYLEARIDSGHAVPVPGALV